jgi:hypothetical protein
MHRLELNPAPERDSTGKETFMIIITEKLVHLDNKYYDILMKQAEDPELNKILHTPVKDLPGYSFLILDNKSDLNNRSILDILLTTRFQYTNKYLSVSADDKKVIGYFAYRIENDVVTTLVMFSFLGTHQKDNKVLLNDVVVRIEELIPKVREIQWTVAKGNTPVIKIYDDIIKGIASGTKQVIPDGYKYTIKGSKK